MGQINLCQFTVSPFSEIRHKGVRYPDLKVLLSGAAKDANEAASAAYFGGSRVRESIKRQLVREVNRAAICSEFCSVQPVIEWEPHEAACSAHSLGITQV